MFYSIKLIPKKKADYSVKKLHGLTKQYSSLEELKTAVSEVCKEAVLDHFGYIEPGHGAKGKQRWLQSDRDIKDMYHLHEGKREILLWSFNYSDQAHRKRPNSPCDDVSQANERSRYDKHLDKMTEVESIEEDLKKKHSDGPYSEEQLCSWAHLIQMKKHTSYDVPPNKPFWKVRSAHSDKSVSGSSSVSSEASVSPYKWINLRGQCVQQLLQLHELLEKGGISKEQYDDMQSTIMDEVKNFN